MRVRRALAVALTVLATIATAGQSAQASIGAPTPSPNVIWTIDGSGNATPLGAVPDDPNTTCGIGRSKLLLTVVTGPNTYDIHGITKACHTYEPATRAFHLSNRIYVCEWARSSSTCRSGTLDSGVTVDSAISFYEFRADGGIRQFGGDPCFAEHGELNQPGMGLTCSTGGDPYHGAPGHKYNAWGWGVFNLYVTNPNNIVTVSMSPDRISKSAETTVS